MSTCSGKGGVDSFTPSSSCSLTAILLTLLLFSAAVAEGKWGQRIGWSLLELECFMPSLWQLVKMSSWKIILADSFSHGWLLWALWDFCSYADPGDYSSIESEHLPLPLSIWGYTLRPLSAEFGSRLLSTVLIRNHAGSLSYVTAFLQQGNTDASLALTNSEMQGDSRTITLLIPPTGQLAGRKQIPIYAW